MSDKKLQVFISWSQEPSKQIATCVYDLLKEIFPDQNIDFFISTEEVDSGKRFMPILEECLAESYLGIFILTKNNFAKEWLMFEAGALAGKTKNKKNKPKLIPVFFTREEKNIEEPFVGHSHATFDKGSFLKLIYSITKSIFQIDDLNDIQKTRLNNSLNDGWPIFEQKVKQILLDNPENDTTNFTGENLVNLMMNEEAYEKIYPKREIFIKELIENLPNDNPKKIIIFGGITTSLRSETAIRAFVAWISKNPKSKLIICHENADVANERGKTLKYGAYMAEANNYAEVQNRKVEGIKIMQQSLYESLGKKFHHQVSFIEIIKPVSIYVTIQGKTMYLTPVLDKRSSDTYTFKLKGTDHIKETLSYICSRIGRGSNNSESLVNEIEEVIKSCSDLLEEYKADE